ncbi:MAG: sugar phosphate isomerase/epimerase [Dehalococcoidia bacterium]
MSYPALSTMWAQQPIFANDLAAFARVAKAAGYAGIEVSHSTDQAGLETLLRDAPLPVPSLHAPTPKMNSRRGAINTALNLAAVDEDERTEAVEHTLRTIRYAADAGARYVVVHLGGLPRMLAEESDLRRLYNAGRMDSAEAHAARARAPVRRADLIGPHLDAARRSMADLVADAAPRGVAIGLENRLHFHEVPSADETAALLADYALDQAGYWHDVGHAEVQHRLGLIDAPAALGLLAPHLIGAHLHDVRGILDHRAPGSGDVDWSYIRLRCGRMWPAPSRSTSGSRPLLSQAITFLRGAGVLE